MTTSFEVQNLKCHGCANTISAKLGSLNGVNDVVVNVETSTVTFYYEDEMVFTKVKNILSNIGYPEVGDKNALTTKAKSVVSCAIGRMNG